MNLSNKQKQYLKSESHHLKPVVMIGANGFTEGVLAEIESALNFHELIKIKVSAEDRDSKKLICDAIIRETKALAVQQVGSIFTIFRPSDEKKITLPK
ncbi:RNA-binding protein [Gilliamella sp. wkB292]|uniref:ribosome assembly RNA-binding protein YhbY n=1 Tax=unclassified Gilliamella TaxID=2685620 RepID=UPI00080DD1F8|nr:MULTISPECIES: ribosome assembly RNA-binding protein YhbY [Gilliamella]MCX8643157.1 ribosome assembly RNA-binding protein YhbY [Gilliamella sp. B3835]MCX8708548.1 ribosome assembly RNA-binding protein YhbY [Gilliamella sp. B3783]MCX8709622.1 ribosome assembly RNA-binding protein YhbY [Gilliamella sp. B3780]MCX8713222.1 ribosome assembly RNA-binding protein YhbY [Gilliamella sp. B3468]MCX8717757.1 ribosome assembly RNA-binding protein YhbY [Gilliamella sp. B3784]